MNPISFKRHRFPPDVIRYAAWLYFRFTLSVCDVEELLAQRGEQHLRLAVLGDPIRRSSGWLRQGNTLANNVTPQRRIVKSS